MGLSLGGVAVVGVRWWRSLQGNFVGSWRDRGAKDHDFWGNANRNFAHVMERSQSSVVISVEQYSGTQVFVLSINLSYSMVRGF